MTIFLTLSPASTIETLKEEALTALTSDVNQVEDVPKVTSTEEFEIARAVKNKDRAPEYEVIETSKQIKESGIANWDVVYLQFRDPSSGKHFFVSVVPPLFVWLLRTCEFNVILCQPSGNLLPVTFTQPSLLDEEPMSPPPAPPPEFEDSATRTGKRKTRDDE